MYFFLLGLIFIFIVVFVSLHYALSHSAANTPQIAWKAIVTSTWNSLRCPIPSVEYVRCQITRNLIVVKLIFTVIKTWGSWASRDIIVDVTFALITTAQVTRITTLIVPIIDRISSSESEVANENLAIITNKQIRWLEITVQNISCFKKINTT